MALVNRWEKVEKNIRKQEQAETTYSVSIVNDEKLFQINMYGSSTRQNKNSASQIVQFNKQLAEELINILKTEFNI